MQEGYTPAYRLKQDIEESVRNYKKNYFNAYFEVEKKADIFALCNIICSIFSNQKPYEENSVSEEIKKSAYESLISVGLSSKTIDLLVEGLDFDYKKRPNAVDIFLAIKSEINIC